MFNRVTAVVLFVQDFETCLAFYRDQLGLEVVLQEPDFAAFKFADQNFALQGMSKAVELFGALPTPSANTDRVMLCTQVEDVDAAYEAVQGERGRVHQSAGRPLLGHSRRLFPRS